MFMERKKRKVEERKIFQYREQKTCKEQVAEGLYGEASKQEATESHNRQEHGAEITIVQVLMEVATKKMGSARKNHKEKQDLD